MATLPASGGAFWWLPDVEKAHEHQLALIAELEAITGQPAPDVARLASVRWKLSQASRQRRTVLETFAYPDLAKRVSPADAERVKRLREKETVAMAASAQHIARWTMDKIVSDWAGYGRASAAMRASMRKRIAAEKELLFLVCGAPAR